MSKTQIALIFALALMENRISQSYMNNKLSYEAWLEANKDRLLSSEVKEDLLRFHNIELESAVEDMLRQLYEDYLNE